MHYAQPPRLLTNVIDDLSKVRETLARAAPYTPLGGWFMNGVDDEARTSPMWFQNDWVHANLHIEGADQFFRHEAVIEATKSFYQAEIVEPQSIYVNLMAAIAEGGPAHTDNPRFQGRDRSNTPMWLLRSMLWSGLFDRWNILQATSIWWMNDVEGGALRYWPNGPDKPPAEHVGQMANTALVGDNHGMFHQVGPVGPFDQGTRYVTGRAELAPASDESGDWVVHDRGEICYQAPLESYRVSVLWKADVYRNAEECDRQKSFALSLADVAETFNQDLAERRLETRFDLDRFSDPETQPALQAELANAYPESRPIDPLPSIYDAAYA